MAILLVVALQCMLACSLGASPSSKALELAQIMHTIGYQYIDELDDNTISDKAIRGLLSKLDPHSEYLDQKSYDQFQSSHDGILQGIGIEVTLKDNHLVVVTPIDQSPAAKAGVKAGDTITHVDGKYVYNIGLEEAISAIQGKPKTTVSLTIIRADSAEPKVIKIERSPINIPSLSQRLLLNHIGYIKLSLFTHPLKSELEAAIKNLMRVGNPLKGIVIDLRNNPGGLLESAVDATGLFLNSTADMGTLIVSSKHRNKLYNQEYYTKSRDITNGVPMVVLVNSASASGAEIMAAALQHYKRATVIGERSFGKGSIQMVIPLANNNAMKLTTGLYYAPSGKSIQGLGVQPDIEIPEQKLVNLPKLDIREGQYYNSLPKKSKAVIKRRDTMQYHLDLLDILNRDGLTLYQAVVFLLNPLEH